MVRGAQSHLCDRLISQDPEYWPFEVIGSPWCLCMFLLARYAGTDTLAGEVIRDRRAEIWTMLEATASVWAARRRRRELVVCLTEALRGAPCIDNPFLVAGTVVARLTVQLLAHYDPDECVEVAGLAPGEPTLRAGSLSTLRPSLADGDLPRRLARQLANHIGSDDLSVRNAGLAMWTGLAASDGLAARDPLACECAQAGVHQMAFAALQDRLEAPQATSPTSADGIYRIARELTRWPQEIDALLRRGLIEVIIGLLDRCLDAPYTEGESKRIVSR